MRSRFSLVVVAMLVAGAFFAGCGGGRSPPSVRVVLEPEAGAGEQIETSLDEALDEAVDTIERRLDAFGVDGSAERSGNTQIVLELDEEVDEETVHTLTRRGLLQFCEPVTDASGRVAVRRSGIVRYRSHSCEPARDDQGQILIDGATVEYVEWPAAIGVGGSPETIIWQVAKAEVDGVQTSLTGELLEPHTSATTDQAGLQVLLFFEFTQKGAEVARRVTERLSRNTYPLAPFLDGEPVRGDDGAIIAPSVRGIISDAGQISGLGRNEAKQLSELLNAGAYPVPLRVVEE